MIKYLNSFYITPDKKSGNICGLGVIDGKEFEFYLDGEPDSIWVDIHKHWISDNEEAWDGKKSKEFKTFDECVTYINKLFQDDIINIKPIGFNRNETLN